MAIPIIGDIINAAKDIVSEVVVDKDKKIEANIRLKELEDKYAERVHNEIIAIQEVNKTEAQHSSVFVAGWRPAVGWAGAAGFAWATILQPIGEFTARITGYSGGFPELNTELLIMVLGGMLGIGGLRTFEKIKGVATPAISAPVPTTPTTVEVSNEGDVSVTTNNNNTPPVAPKKKKFKVF